MTRKLFFAANWKMHMGVEDTKHYLNHFLIHTQGIEGDVAFFVPYTVLAEAKKLIPGFNVKIGAQNLHYEDRGAFTGEISPAMLKELCTYVLIGHSERRQLFHETDEHINKKLKKAIETKLLPVLCIGETEEQRENNETNDVLAKQLQKAFENINENDVSKIIIAYEPIWAIGTGKTATTDLIQEVHSYIRQTVEAMYSFDVANEMRILYGGSVKPENAKEILSQEDVDGVLVGGASLTPESFLGIIKA